MKRRILGLTVLALASSILGQPTLAQDSKLDGILEKILAEVIAIKEQIQQRPTASPGTIMADIVIPCSSPYEPKKCQALWNEKAAEACTYYGFTSGYVSKIAKVAASGGTLPGMPPAGPEYAGTEVVCTK